MVKIMERINEVGRRIAIDKGVTPIFHLLFLLFPPLPISAYNNHFHLSRDNFLAKLRYEQFWV